MGSAYLSRPIKEKISDDQSNARLSYGACSMQGWRSTQEDAHNCIIDFDDNTSLFGVYDGHGGFEVAQYTAEKLPNFIRKTMKYKESSYKEALIEAFLGFDDTLRTRDVRTVLKEMVAADKQKKKADTTRREDSDDSDHDASDLVDSRRTPHDRAGCSSSDGECVDGDPENPESLRLDASIPIEEVMASHPVPTINKPTNSEIGEPEVGRFPDSCKSNIVNECGSSSLQSSSDGSDAFGDDRSKVSGDFKESAPNDESNESASKCGKSSCATSDESIPKEDSDFYRGPGGDSGCTAVVTLVKENRLYVANAGDSRCIICKAGNAIDMSEDHKPDDYRERSRIHKAGGRVSDGRVQGGLNLSRAIGDHHYKKNKNLPNTEQMVTALPDVREIELEPEIEFIVLACDGIWNPMSSQEVVDFIRPKIKSNQKLSSICEELFDNCLADQKRLDDIGCDNMTCIIVKPIHDVEAVKSSAKISASVTANDDPGASGEVNSAEKSDASLDDSVKPVVELSGGSGLPSAPATKARIQNSKGLVADAEGGCKRFKTDDSSTH